MGSTVAPKAIWSRRLARDAVAWGALAALLFGFALLVVAPALGRQTHGYAVYYTAARLLIDGHTDALYNDRAFIGAMRHYGIHGVYDIWDANAPTTALVLLPLAGLPTTLARPLWVLANLALLMLAALCSSALIREFLVGPYSKDSWQVRRPTERTPGVFILERRWLWQDGDPYGRGMVHGWLGRSLPVVLAALLLYHPIAVNLALGQMYIFLLALLAAAMLALARDHPTLAGLAFACILTVKGYYGLLFLLPLFPTRQWRVLVTALAAWLVIVLVTLPRMGLSAWSTYLQSSRALSNAPSTSVTAYQTLHGLLGHLLWGDARWNPHPWLNAPGVADLLWLAGAAGLVGLALFATWRAVAPMLVRRQGTLVGITLMIPISLVIAPLAEEYHYALLVLPLLLLWGQALRVRWPPAWFAPLAVATILVAAPFPTYGQHFVGLPASLLYYSKLAGALIVFWLTLACAPVMTRSGSMLRDNEI